MTYTNEERNAYNRKYYHENKERTQAYIDRKCEKRKLERKHRKELQKLGLWKSEKQIEKEKLITETTGVKFSTPPKLLDENEIIGTIKVDKGLFIIEW